MKTTHSTSIKARSERKNLSCIESLLTTGSQLTEPARNARDSRASGHADRSTKCETHRSLAGFTVASFLAVCLLPVSLSAQAPVFTGVQTVPLLGGNPVGVAVDASGNLFELDFQSGQVFKLPAGGGNPTVVYSQLNSPQGIAVDRLGNIYIADTGDNLVLKFEAVFGVTDYVGTGLLNPEGVAVDDAGNVYIADNGNRRVVKVPAGGGAQTTVGRGFSNPIEVAVDGLGNVYVTDALSLSQTQLVKVPAGGGTYSAVGTNLQATRGIAVDPENNLYADDAGMGVVEIPADGSPQITLMKPSELNHPFGLAVDGAGDIFVADFDNLRVLELQTKSVNFGNVYPCSSTNNLASCGAPLTLNFVANQTGGFYESGISTQGASNLDFTPAAGGSCVRSALGYSCTVNVAFSPKGVGVRQGAIQVADSAGDVTTIYLRGIGLAPQLAFTPSAQTTIGSGLKRPAGTATDGAGNVYIADSVNNRVVKVPAAGGAQTTVGNGLNSPEAVAVDGAGNVIIVDTGSGQVFKVSTAGVQTAVKTNLTSLSSPDGVAVDGAGNLFISDSFEGIVEVPADGSALISIASGLALGSEGVAVDRTGNVFLADTGNNRILKVPAGGGSPTTISTTDLKAPNGIAVDAAGDLFILDGGNDRVVEVPAGGGAQFVIAGNLNAPSGLFVDAAGDVFIGDSGNNRVLKLARSNPPALNFGFTAPATTANGSPKTVIVENIGNQPLNVTDVNYPRDFPVDFDENGNEELCIGSTTMAPGGLCDLTINFTPLSMANFNETVKLSYKWEDLIVPATVSVAVSGSSLKLQTIAFTPPASVTYGAAPVNLAGHLSDSAGLPITLSVVSGPAKISGTTVIFTGAGSVVVKASQPGTSSYAAVSVEKTITVNKAHLTVTATSASVAYGKALPALQFTISGLVNGDTSKVVSGAPVETTTAKLNSPPAAYPIDISQGTLKAANYTFAFKNGILTIQSLGIASAPVFNPAGGTYTAEQHITITDKTPGAAIYYALGGATPSTSSTKYTGPISITSTETVRAIVVAPGYSNSPIASTTFTVQ